MRFKYKMTVVYKKYSTSCSYANGTVIYIFRLPRSPSVGQPVQDAKYAYHAKLASCVYNVWFLFSTTNSIDSDEMLHYAASHQDLHCYQKINILKAV